MLLDAFELLLVAQWGVATVQHQLWGGGWDGALVLHFFLGALQKRGNASVGPFFGCCLLHVLLLLSHRCHRGEAASPIQLKSCSDFARLLLLLGTFIACLQLLSGGEVLYFIKVDLEVKIANLAKGLQVVRQCLVAGLKLDLAWVNRIFIHLN